MKPLFFSHGRDWLIEGLRTIIYSSLVILAISCSTATRRVDDVVVYPSASENPSDEIAKLESEVEDARSRNVNLLAPTWFASADTSLANARKLQNEGGDFRRLFKRVAEGRVQIQRANEIAETSHKVVPDVLAARETARSTEQDAVRAGATNLNDIRSAMRSADDKFIKITKSIEDGNLENMLDRRQDAVKAYAAVEAKALRKGKLDTAKRVVDEAVNQGAKRYAPKSLSYAQEVISNAEQLITSNPKAEVEIAKKSDEALFYARRALLFTQQARDVASRSPEDTVLWMEQSITSVADEAGSADMRDERLDNQISALRSKVGDLRTSAVATRTAPATPKKNFRASKHSQGKQEKM